MRLLLSHGYFIHEDEAEQKIMMPYPPQGLLHIGTFLKTKGIDCQIFDSTFNSFPALCAFLEKEKPTYLGLYTNLMTRPNIIRIINFIRNTESLKKTVVVLGGPDVRYHTGLYIEHGADFCIPGEGENTLLQLIRLLDKNDQNGIQNLRGITFLKDKGKLVSTGEGEMISSLDDLPFPDFEMISINKYFDTWKSSHGYRSITISTMRGCPYSCRWCSKAVYGKSFRRRSANSVVKEMERLAQQYSPDRFWIVDDVFTINKQWLAEFKEAVHKAKLQIKYECITRADRMDEEIVMLLKESGCFRLWIGAESGSQKVLDLMARGVKVEVVRDIIKLVQSAGIEAGTFLMLGYPGESETDILKTVKHLRLANPDHCTITLSYPIPGTYFYNDVKDKGLVAPGEWGTYSDRSLDFTRTYKRNYYKHATRYVNHAFLKHRNLKNGNLFVFIKYSLTTTLFRILMMINR